MALWKAPLIWQGGTCYIIAGGPSVPRQFGVPEHDIQEVMNGKLHPRVYSSYMFRQMQSKHVIGINNAYLIGDWIDILFFGDCGWYKTHCDALAEWPGLKVTCCEDFSKSEELCEGVKYLAMDKGHRVGISSNRSMVSWNQNSGAAAISLAAHLGVKKIVLLGFDMNLDENSMSHWHGCHIKVKRKKPPPFQRHLRGFSAIARDADIMGIEIINASPESAIKEFPKRNIKDVVSI